MAGEENCSTVEMNKKMPKKNRGDRSLDFTQKPPCHSSPFQKNERCKDYLNSECKKKCSGLEKSDETKSQ
jgi:hypothetical protein